MKLCFYSKISVIVGIKSGGHLIHILLLEGLLELFTGSLAAN